MKLLIEDYPYKAEVIEHILQGIDALRRKDGLVRVSYVGYYYNNRIKDCIFVLPKVVINEANPPKVLGKYAPEDIINVGQSNMEKTDKEFIYGLSAWVYRAVKEYQRLNDETEIVYENTFSRIDGSKTNVQNTLLDIILSLIDFNRREKEFFMFHVKNLHSGYNRINWSKTISKGNAFLQDGHPIYMKLINRHKEINYDEELIVIFYSILNYVHQKYGFHTQVNFNYELITGNEFQRYLQHYGKLRLRQIKYRYFSDKEVMMWKLCYAFFELSEIINSTRQGSDYLLVKNFNIVFEAMIDELLSDKELKTGELANQPDGKIVDHIFPYEGVLNNGEQIYYIGDSKYYKIGNVPGKESVYKQYTYARNVIQHNLGLFLKNSDIHSHSYLIYRDEDTEGYNVTPNFFISGFLSDTHSYKDAELTYKRDEEPIMHFKNRLFDRDTLLLQHYDVNFLFILALYGNGNEGAKESFRDEARDKFRKHFIKYLEKHYQFFSLQKKNDNDSDISDCIKRHFKDIIGKAFRPYKDEDIIYLAFDKKEEFNIDNLILLGDLSKDFIVRSYKLGSDPRDQINSYYVFNSTLEESTRPFCVPAKPKYSELRSEVFLIGGYHINRKDWIFENGLYTIQDKGQLFCTDKTSDTALSYIDPMVASARYLVLFDLDDANKGYSVHEISSYKHMGEKGKNNASMDCLVYSFNKTPMDFERIDLNALLKAQHTDSIDAPCYVLGEEIAEYAKD